MSTKKEMKKKKRLTKGDVTFHVLNYAVFLIL